MFLTYLPFFRPKNVTTMKVYQFVKYFATRCIFVCRFHFFIPKAHELYRFLGKIDFFHLEVADVTIMVGDVTIVV